MGTLRAPARDMDENEFKKHLRDLAHGHHHPEEHDWRTTGNAAAPAKRTKKTQSPKARSAKRRAK